VSIVDQLGSFRINQGANLLPGINTRMVMGLSANVAAPK
jgi:hypothetical protein